MIKIPGTNKKFSIPNISDLFGNIWYSRNVNFDEAGYVKLSNRAVQLISEEDDASFNLVLSFGRMIGTTDDFHMVTFDSPYDSQIGNTGLSTTKDISSNAPAFSIDSWGRWFQNRWHATTPTKMWYETSIGSGWTDTGVTLTTGFVHPIEVFRTRNTICVGNGNVLKQFTAGYGASVADLTIPSGFEIIGLCFSGGKMGIITMLSDSVSGQNQDAYFFVWDGLATSANNAYPIGSDMAVAIAPYKSSWVILTRSGEFKYFNGGSWQKLSDMPFVSERIDWGDGINRGILGDGMAVDRDRIFLNVDNNFNAFGPLGESYLQNNPAGILCYDPEVGLYHRYSPSISPANRITVPSSGVDATADIFTLSAGTLYETGNPIKYVYDSSTPIGGLTPGAVYYIIKHTATTFSLALTKEDALNLVKIDITGTGATDNYFIALNVIDYGTVNLDRVGSLAFVGRADNVANHMIFSADCADKNSLNTYDTLCLTMSGFPSRGYIVTSKITSPLIDDTYQKIFVKFKPLKSGDSIIVKQKRKEVVGLPTTTMHYASFNLCSWTSDKVFTTTIDLSAVKAYLDLNPDNECEAEIISGAGAGQMAQIASIGYSGGTYTVTLAESIDGAANGLKCDIIVDNWELLGEITSDSDQGYEELPTNGPAVNSKFKVEMRGTDVTIEELTVINEINTIPG